MKNLFYGIDEDDMNFASAHTSFYSFSVDDSVKHMSSKVCSQKSIYLIFTLNSISCFFDNKFLPLAAATLLLFIR